MGSHDTVGQALELMREHGVSQVPVVSSRGRAAFIGTVSERGLLWASADHPGILGEQVTEVLEAPLPEPRSATPPTTPRMLREDAGAVIVLEDGRPLGVLTAVDLVEALNR